MALFYKLTLSGISILYVKTLFMDEIDEELFDKKAKRVVLEKFLKMVPEKERKNIKRKVERLQCIYEMKLSVFGSQFTEDRKTGHKNLCYYVANKEFRVENIQENKMHEIQKARRNAITLGEEIYGKNFMKENIRKLDSGTLYYCSDCVFISKTAYESVAKEQKYLTQITCVDNRKQANTKRVNKK